MDIHLTLTLHLKEPDLRLLERIHGLAVIFDERRQVMWCRHCRAQRMLHRTECPYATFGRLIDSLQRQEDGE